MNITKKLINHPEKKASLEKLYRLQRGCYNPYSNQDLPKYSFLYAYELSPRQKSIINIILFIELIGSKGFFDAKTDWIVQHISKVGHKMTKNILDKDLRYLESLGLIYRNTWNLPQRSGGGRKRQICSAWSIESFEKNFIFRQSNRKKNDVKPKPAHVFEGFFAYAERVIKDNRQALPDNLPPPKGSSIKKFHPLDDKKNLYRDKIDSKNIEERGFDTAKPKKSLVLHTKEEIIEHLKDPDKERFNKIFFESAALEGLNEELFPFVLREIVRTNKKIVGTFIKAAETLEFFFTDAEASCLECLISLYEDLNYLVKSGKLKNIRNLITYTIKCFTIKRCVSLLFKIQFPKEKTVYLFTTQEIIGFLDRPNQNTSYKVFFCSKAQEGLSYEHSKKALRIIGKLHCKGKSWGPCAEDYLEYLCDNVISLVKQNAIEKPRNLIAYTLRCHKPALFAKFMDERHNEKIKMYLEGNKNAS